MILDHERMDVYVVALDFMVFANEVVEGLPRGRSHLADQLVRASTSIVLNVAEGAGKLSRADKRRFYMTARGSATECAALFDILQRLHLVPEPQQRHARDLLLRIVSMLIKLARSLEPSDPS